MSDGVILLGEVAARAAVITVACRTCLRRGRLRTDQLLLTHGPHMPMPTLLRILAGACPRVNSPSIAEQCDVHSPTLGELFSQRQN